MANQNVVQYEQAPAHLQKYRPSEADVQEYVVPGGIPIGFLSLEGKKFAVKYKGDTYPSVDAQGFARQYLDLVVAMSNPKITKSFYLKEYQQGVMARPDCYSLDGVTPEPDSPEMQSHSCVGCQWNAWNSGKGKGKACKDGKRLAVLQTEDMPGDWFGGPILLRLPPITFVNWRKYVTEDLARDRNILPHGVVTRVSFDPQETWDLNFQFVRYIDEHEDGWIEHWRTNEEALEIVGRVLGVSEQTGGMAKGPADAADPYDAAAEGMDEPEPEPEPEPVAQPVQQTRPAPQAAARPANAAPAGRPAPASQAPQPEPAAPVAAARPSPQRPAQAPSQPRQAPTPQPAPQGRPAPAAAAGGAPRPPARGTAPAATGPTRRPAPQAAQPQATSAQPQATSAGTNGSRRRPPPGRGPTAASQAQIVPDGPLMPGDLPVAGQAEQEYDVDGAVDALADGDGATTASIFDALDGAPGIPGR